MSCNPQNVIKEEEILDIIAEVPGMNDELQWYWVLELTEGRTGLIVGWCDYTGWDCRSAITVSVHQSPRHAIAGVPEEEDWSKRRIKENLLHQIDGKQIVGLYQEEA
jgi:hypothetical protein